MYYLHVFLIWFISTFFWGLLGVFIGPGIVMLFMGLFVGISGYIYSLLEKIFSLNIRWFWAGFIVSISSFILTISVFSKISLAYSDYLFPILFIVVPSFFIVICIKKFKNWFLRE